MSNRTVLFALLAAVALGLITVLMFVVPPSRVAPGIASGANIGIGTGNIKAIMVSQPGGAAGDVAISRTSASGAGEAWELKYRGRTFGCEPARVRAALSILASATAMGTVPAASEAEAMSKANGTLVRLVREDLSESALRFGARGIGGTVLAQITELMAGGKPGAAGAGPGGAVAGEKRFAIVSADLEGLFQIEALLTWRLVHPLSELAQQPSRVRVIMPAGSLALSRTGANWSVTEPVVAPAETESVAKLLKAMELVTIVRFFDDGAPALAGEALARPQARISIERDEAAVAAAAEGAGAGPRRVVRRELRIGASPADPGRKTLFASIDDEEFVLAIDAAPLLGLTIEPTKFIAATAVGVPSGEISGMTVTLTAVSAPDGVRTVTFKRTLDGWTEQRSDGQAVLLTKDRGADVQASLDFFTKTKAASVSLSLPEPNVELATVTLSSLGGEPLARLRIVAAEGGGSNLFVGPPEGGEGAAVWRSYPKMSALLDFLISPTLGAAAAKFRSLAPEGKPAGEVPDVNK